MRTFIESIELYPKKKEKTRIGKTMEKPKKLNTIKTSIVIYFTLILVLLLTACSKEGTSETAVSVEQETVKIKIITPSDVESTIAPGRHFKVSGALSGEIPDDAILRVTLLDAAGNETCYAAADQKGTDRVIPSICTVDFCRCFRGSVYTGRSASDDS